MTNEQVSVLSVIGKKMYTYMLGANMGRGENMTVTSSYRFGACRIRTFGSKPLVEVILISTVSRIL